MISQQTIDTICLSLVACALWILYKSVQYLSKKYEQTPPRKMTTEELEDLFRAIDLVCSRTLEIYTANKMLNTSLSGEYTLALHIEKGTKQVISRVLDILAPLGMIPEEIDVTIVKYISELVMLKMTSNASRAIVSAKMSNESKRYLSVLDERRRTV